MYDSEDELKPKKLKVEQSDPIFVRFWNDKAKKKTLIDASFCLNGGFTLMKFCALRIDGTSARWSNEFSSAHVKTSVIERENGEKVIFNLGRVFLPGIIILEAYLHKEERKLPVDTFQRRALAQLLNFLSLDHAALRKQKDYSGKEGEWVLILSQHLLAPLAVEKSYVIDSYKEYSRNFTSDCPCEEKDSLVGKEGDTSFGCSRGWHGRADILMEGLPIELSLDSDAESSELDSLSSATGMKASGEFSEKHKNQLIVQTIVFSFLQRKINKDKLKNALIPGLGISHSQVVGYFYDCEEDVLLQTLPLDLFCNEKRTLNIHAVVFIWLTLNYRQFCSGIDDVMKNFKADFFSRVGEDFLEVYRKEVDRPMHVQKSCSEEFNVLLYGIDPDRTIDTTGCQVDLCNF